MKVLFNKILGIDLKEEDYREETQSNPIQFRKAFIRGDILWEIKPRSTRWMWR
jgi:hypothetical protein